ncbi:MAG: branched-chain amino acid ABC transporter permease [Desulfobacterales bacterium]|nr:MAG: branched-chain amino acid ABC transporter permease [Desulfobacterales bacterium]
MKDKPASTATRSHIITLLILLLPLIIIAAVTKLIGNVLFERVVITLFINLILVLGLQAFMGNSGILSFAHIGFMGIGAYASVLFSMAPQMKKLALPDLPLWLGHLQLPFLPSILIGAIIAALIAAVVSFPLMRLSDASAVITSFALLVVIHTILVHWKTVTNGPQTLFGVDRYTHLETSMCWAFIFIALAYWFKESSIGLQLRASRDEREAASTIGVNIILVRWQGFILSAFMAGLGGGLWAHFITSFSPKAFWLKETFVILSMLVIGGPNSVSGAVVGALLVTGAFEGLRGLENQINIAQILPVQLIGLTEIVLSLTMIVILIKRPLGIMGGREFR